MLIKKLAPIVIFIYKRPYHLETTLKNLKQCKEFNSSPVIVYADGAKIAEEQELVEKTRETAKEMLGDHAEYHFQDHNKGLSSSVIQGVSDTLKRYDRIIVIEDDLKVTPNFLSFMNEALTRYENEDSVYQVSGYQFGAPKLKDRNTALFLPITVSWGWGTWKRAWADFDSDAKGWGKVLSDKNLRYRFNLDGAYDFSRMLVSQMQGQRDSWAIRWYWTVFIKNGLVLFPPVSLVDNTGFDGSGTHGKGVFRKFGFSTNKMNRANYKLPNVICISEENFVSVRNSLKTMNGSWYGFALDRIIWFKTIFR